MRIFKAHFTKPLPKDAEIVTRKGKRCARFKDRRGRTVVAPLSKDGKKIRIETSRYYIEYRDCDNIQRRVPGCKDKQATVQKVAELERDVERRQVGLIDRYADQRRRPLKEHIDEFEASLRAKGVTELYCERQVAQLRTLFKKCRFDHWSDITASTVQSALAEMRKPGGKGTDGLSARTANSYLQISKQFCVWMIRDGRAPTSPLAHLQRYNMHTDRRLVRRALTLDECQRLLAAAAAGERIYGMDGPDRAMLYRLILQTGLRVAEMRSLAPESFSLDADPPTVTVEAGFSKHRRKDVLPLTPKFAAELKAYLAGKLPGQPVFKPHAVKTANMVRHDLEAAGIKTTRPGQKRPILDFHTLRHSFITLGAQAGIAPKVLMDLARHSDINLTMGVYSHTVVADRAKALESIPDPAKKNDEGDKKAASA